MPAGNFWTKYDQSLAELCLFTEVRYDNPKKKYGIFYSQWKQSGKMCKKPKFLPHFSTLRYSKMKKIVVHSKSFIKKNGYVVKLRSGYRSDHKKK